MNANHFSLHWIDLIVVGVLIVGILRGRKNGMSGELILMVQWVAVVLGAAIGHRAFGNFIMGSTGMTKLFSYVVSYITCAVLVSVGFAFLRRWTGGKLAGSDIFGNGEYYLGMAAGAVRFGCMTIVALALLNAKLITPQQLAAQEKFQDQNFGSIRFPTIGTTQQAVFKKSFVGRSLKNHAGFLLIESAPLEKREFRQKEFDVPGA